MAEATWQAEAAKWDHLRRLRIATALGSARQRSAALAAELEGAVIFSVEFRFPATKPHKDGDPKITRPDTDNMVKLLKDCMTRLGFWTDDAQVCMETVRKSYAAEPGVRIIVSKWGAR